MNKDRRIKLLTAVAAQVFGDRKRAEEWMSTPNKVLSGAVPKDLAATRIGGSQVNTYLLRIEYGVYC